MTTLWQTFFDAHPPTQCDDFSQLPSQFIAPLPAFTLTTMQGEESEKYLQGQITADVAELPNQQWSLAAHCDAKGKTWATYFVGKQSANDFILLSSRGAASKSLPELTKFSVFSQTDIAESDTHLLFYVYGEHSANLLNKIIPSHNTEALNDKAYVTDNANHVLKLAANRFIIALPNAHLATLFDDNAFPLLEESAFLYHETLAARPYLFEETCSQYVPQMLNLQAIQAISFTKGCYIGQETVARMRYLGKNKRATFLIEADTPLTDITPGSNVQRALGENWRNAGTVLQSVTDHHKTYALAVLPKDISADDTLRFEAAVEANVTLQPLPYELSDE